MAGIKTDVANMTGFTNTRSSMICAYETAALRKVRIVIRGIVCKRVVYGTTDPFGAFFVQVVKRTTK